MKFITQRAVFFSFALQKIESNASAEELFSAVAEFFGLTAEEKQLGRQMLSNPTLAGLKTVEDLRLMKKCADGFGAFQLSADDEEVLDLKFQALQKIGQLAGECRTTPRKAVTSAYRRDPVAAVLYALQIFMHNKQRALLGHEILSESLSADQNSDAGLILLNVKQDDRATVYEKLAETPEMILHPEVLEELAKAHGLNPATVRRDSAKIGF